MHKKFILPHCYFFIFIFAFYFTDVSGQKEELRTEIDKLIRFDTEINYKDTPGFIVGIVDNDSTYVLNFGSKIKKTRDTINENDIFETGSITKAFTASLISVLVNEKVLSYQDTVNNFFPDEYKNPRLSNLQLIDLITHRSGFPKRPAFFGRKEKNNQNPYEYYSNTDLLKFYRDFIPSRVQFEYSHTNYALIELIIEKVTGKNFADVLADKIFFPLNLQNSFIDFPEQKYDLITPGYDRAGKKVFPWLFKSFKASEALKSSVRDLLTFMKANLGMSGTSLDSTFSHNFLPLFNESFNSKLSVGMGWHMIDMNHFNIITHTGKTTGYNAFIGMIRETKTAVVILANSSIGTEDLGLQILRMINYNWKRIQI